VRLDRRLAEEAPHTRMLLQIHDELVLETPQAHLEETRVILVETMERAMELAVPLRVDSSSAENWFDAG
jgi:DNA polymerase-1